MEDNNIKEKTKELERPKFKRLNNCLNCRDCPFYSYRIIGQCPGTPDHRGECFKRFGILWILYWGITSFILAFCFHKIYFEITEQKFFHSLLATLLIAFPIDIICVLIEKVYNNFFIHLEKKRKEKFNLELEQYELMIKAKENKAQKSNLKFDEMEKLKLLYENLLKFNSELNNSNLEHLENGNSIKNDFKKMLDLFYELINILEPEMLENISLRHFLTIHMEEFLKISNKFLEEHYTSNEEKEYILLIGKVYNKTKNYIAQVNSSTILDFNISIKALSKAIGDNESENSKGEDL